MAIEKTFLDYTGLQAYDSKLKDWVKALQETSASDVTGGLQAQIDALNELVGEGTVDERVAAAVAGIVDSAPETFDTLKEVASWIEDHGEAAAALIQTVADQGQEIVALDHKIDEVADSIQAISGTYIDALFLDAVTVAEGQTIQDAIDTLGEGQKLVLTEDVAEDLTINHDAVIEADGVTFSGKITVAQGIAATVIGATFTGEVVVA